MRFFLKPRFVTRKRLFVTNQFLLDLVGRKVALWFFIKDKPLRIAALTAKDNYPSRFHTESNMNENILVNVNENEEASTKEGSRALKTIALGGFVVGMLDGLFALVFYGLIFGVPILRIFQSVASGVLGRETARAGGVPTFLLGLVLHFVVASCITTVYYLASLRLPFLNRLPIISGSIYGMLAYLGMHYIVIPLSRVTPGDFNLLDFVVSIIGHALLVGLPIALITSHFAKNEK